MNIIANFGAVCLLAVRMNFGVSDEFCVRQIVMGNLFWKQNLTAEIQLSSIGNRIIQYKSHSSKRSEERKSDYKKSLKNIVALMIKISGSADTVCEAEK